MNTDTHLYRAVALACLLVPALPGVAQTASDSPGPAEEIVTLKEFNVTGEAVDGYGANESLTGTRVASRLSDLPLSVNVVTHDFIQDFNLFDLNQQLAFVSGFSGSDGQNNGLSSANLYQLRGFQSPTTLVDGFRRIGLVSEVNIDRIEVIKGTAANVYGSIVPGGVVNIITRRPTTTPTQELDFSYGAFQGGGQWNRTNNQKLKHATASSSGPLGTSGKLFYRVDLSYLYMPYGQEWANRRQTYGAIQLLYKPDEKTDIRLEVEDDDLKDHPRQRAPQIDIPGAVVYQPSKAATIFVGTATPLAGPWQLPADFHGDGPEAYLINRSESATLTFEHRFSDVWSLRGSFNRYKTADHQLYSTTAYYPLGVNANITQTAVVVGPQWIKDPQSGTGYQIDSLITIPLGDWAKNKLLFTHDYNEVSKIQWDYVGASTYYNAQTGGLISPYTYTYNFPLPEDNPAFYSRASFNNFSSVDDYGFFASDNLSILKDRIFALAGIRYDYLSNGIRNFIFADPVTALTHRQDTSYSLHGWTHELGLLGKVTPQVSVFINASSSFNPQTQLDQNANPLPNNTANGVEFGTKAALFNGHLNFSVLHFEVNEFDLAHSTRDVNDNVIVVLTGQETAKGYEADVNWQPTPALQIFGGFGYTQAAIVSSFGLYYLDNTPAPQAPRDNLGVGARYTIRSGLFKGVYFTASEQYDSKSLISPGSGSLLTATAAAPVINIPFPNGGLPFPKLPANATVTSGTAVVPDGRENIFNAPYNLLGLGVGYGFRTGRYSQRISFEVTNVLDRFYTFGQAASGNPREFITSYRITL